MRDIGLQIALMLLVSACGTAMTKTAKPSPPICLLSCGQFWDFTDENGEKLRVTNSGDSSQTVIADAVILTEGKDKEFDPQAFAPAGTKVAGVLANTFSLVLNKHLKVEIDWNPKFSSKGHYDTQLLYRGEGEKYVIATVDIIVLGADASEPYFGFSPSCQEGLLTIAGGNTWSSSKFSPAGRAPARNRALSFEYSLNGSSPSKCLPPVGCRLPLKTTENALSIRVLDADASLLESRAFQWTGNKICTDFPQL